MLTIAIVGGTMAFFTDTDSAKNTMTLGSVKIEQKEYEREKNDDGSYKTGTVDNLTSYMLKEFTQDKPLFPIVGDPNEPGDSSNGYAYAGWDPITVRFSQKGSYGGMQVFAGKNAQDKFVTVTNTGKSPAYVRTLVAIEIGEGDPNLIMTSRHSTWTDASDVIATIDGKKYIVNEFVYAGGELSDGSWRHEKGILPANDTTYPSLCQIYLKSKTTNEDIIAIDGEQGDGKLNILVLSQACQVEGFENAQTALDTAFGDVTADNAAEWFDEILNP